MKSFFYSFFILFFCSNYLYARNIVFNMTGSYWGNGDVVGVFSFANSLRNISPSKNYFKGDDFYVLYGKREKEIMESSFEGSMEDLSIRYNMNFVALENASEIPLADFSFEAFYGGRNIHHFTDLIYNKKETLTFILDTMHGTRLDEIRRGDLHLYMKPLGMGPHRSGFPKNPIVEKIKKKYLKKSRNRGNRNGRIIEEFVTTPKLRILLESQKIRVAFGYGIHNEVLPQSWENPEMYEYLRGQTKSFLEALDRNNVGATKSTIFLTPNSEEVLRKAGINDREIFTLDLLDVEDFLETLGERREETGKTPVISLGGISSQEFTALIALSDEPALLEGDNSIATAVQLGKRFIPIRSDWNDATLQDLIFIEKQIFDSTHFRDSFPTKEELRSSPPKEKKDLGVLYDAIGDNEYFFQNFHIRNKKDIGAKFSELIPILEEYLVFLQGNRGDLNSLRSLLERALGGAVKDPVFAFSLVSEAVTREILSEDDLEELSLELTAMSIDVNDIIERSVPIKPGQTEKFHSLERRRPLALSDLELQSYPRSYTHQFNENFKDLSYLSLRSDDKNFNSPTLGRLRVGNQIIYPIHFPQGDFFYDRHNPEILPLQGMSLEGYGRFSYSGSEKGLSKRELKRLMLNFSQWFRIAQDPDDSHFFVIMEEGTKLLDPFYERLKSALYHAPNDWDLILLNSNQEEEGGCHHGDYDDYDPFSEESSRRYIKLDKPCSPGSLGYVLRPSAARKLFEEAKIFKESVSDMIRKYFIQPETKKVYATYPEIIMETRKGPPPRNFGNSLCSSPSFTDNSFPDLQLASEFKEIDHPLVKGVVNYSHPSVKNLYNPSIAKTEDAYLISFRFDCTDRIDTRNQAYTLVSEVDKELKAKGNLSILRKPSYSDLSKESHNGEDLRLYNIDDEIYGIANDSEDGRSLGWDERRMQLYKIDDPGLEWRSRLTHRLERPPHSPFHGGPEKNWVFARNEKIEKNTFGYLMTPHNTLLTVKETENLLAETEYLSVCHTTPPWDKEKYGVLRGGTPALWDEELGGNLGFFHSVKAIEDGKEYYMGAYVISGENGCISHISPEPILYDGIYDEEQGYWLKYTGLDSKVVFPAGLVEGKWGGDDVYILTAGVNDTAAKAFIIDKHALIYSLLNTDEEMSKRLREKPEEDLTDNQVVQSYLREHKVFASLTTSPSRINSLRPMLQTISDSEYLEKIFLVLPERYGRNGEKYDIPEWLTDDLLFPKLEILRVKEDLGPITKILPAVRKVRNDTGDPDSIVISFDDDIGYTKGTVGQLIKTLAENPRSVAGGSSAPLRAWGIDNTDHWSQEADSLVIEGYGSIAYRVGDFNDQLMEKIVKENRYCFVSDDIVLSWALDRSGVSRIFVENEYMGRNQNFPFTYGFGLDALHRGGGISETAAGDLNAQKYRHCNEFLASFPDVPLEEPIWEKEAIEESLSTYHERSLSYSEVYEAYKAISHKEKALIRIEKGTVTFEHPENAHALNRLSDIVKALRKGLPVYAPSLQTDFILDFGDGDDFLSGINVPIFRLSKLKKDKGILIPDDPFSGNLTRLAFDVQEHPWEEKIPKAYFRGATTGGLYTAESYLEMPRAQLALLSQKHSDLLDAGFSLLAEPQFDESFIEDFKKEFTLYPRDPESRILDYRYALDVDGNTNGWARPRYILSSNTLCIKHKSPFEQWFYPILESGTHFVEVERNFSDLIEKISWLESNPEKTKEIISQANIFSKEVFSEASQIRYLVLAISEYAKKFTP